ncbi:unnamed protein product [Trichogramma brassicae]|uniref:Integrase zinc-binding domain-containing protein n=1 Tax=Trichogramma brassicae TaxID=86971 RepID=A0A6H5J146_9HYME|nr:unnamed protein product [Trichogramma brassicae]
MLYTNSIIVPPVHDRMRAIRDYHESCAAGHRGINATYNRLAQDFYWKNMRPDVDAYVKRYRFMRDSSNSERCARELRDVS